MLVTLQDISKSFGGTAVLDRVSFTVQAGELVSLIGPSGVGKTTLLNIIAGLERADSGALLFSTPPSRQNPVILVFQDYLLFPALTVEANVAFGLGARGWTRARSRARVAEMLAFFKLEDKAKAHPHQLSAGQKQRVAIARAMVVEPSVLLLDEPFANLDRNLKMETARFIRQTQQTFGITTVAVTHDLEEAFAMSDKIGILLDGRLEQFDTTARVYHQPATLRAARFLGPVNQIPPELAPELGVPPERRRPHFVRPEGLAIIPHPAGPAVVREVVFAGHYISYQVTQGPHQFTVYSLSHQFAVGDRVRLRLKDNSQLKENRDTWQVSSSS